MKPPRKLTPPPVDTRKELYFEINESVQRDYHSGEQFGEWETIKNCSLSKISRNKGLLSKWNFYSYQVNDEVYNAQNLYVVVVEYSSGDSFGRSEGNLAVAFVTENSQEAIECRDAILENEAYEYENRYSFRDKTGKKPMWDDKFRDHPKSVCKGYSPWRGYFEHVSGVSIEFLTVMG
jgi:hypothetical protein